ncbi:Putative uncharacterized protein [Moritella viscosa]|uniref:hypothetical protein n=1 Tax=Moritella viscosa TaxID=80854 RepID=UPI00091FBA58|nr:hypothetical protein [Moritella viscosa]SHO20121.1 Putative uncharacterized protein [Moritella viscosa]
MALATIATVASLAMEFGPTVLRGIGSLFGGKTAEVTNDVAKAVEYVEGALPSDKSAQQDKLNNMLSNLPPETLVELEKVKIELEKEQTRRLELQLADKQAAHHETQTTIREGDKADDEYVRRTRPFGCRLSLYAAILYIFVFDVLSALDKGDGANWELASMLIAPFMTYLGVRTVDKAKASGAKFNLNPFKRG